MGSPRRRPTAPQPKPMNSQRLLLLVLVVLAAAGGLFLLSTDPGSEGDETLPLALGEEPLEPTEPEESTELAPAALASEDGGGRTSARVDVDAANARQVEVVVTMPAGTTTSRFRSGSRNAMRSITRSTPVRSIRSARFFSIFL